MSRPKGSKNKTKGILATVKEAVVEAVTEAKKEAVSEVVKEWKPKPEMGSIKPPETLDTAKCTCLHEKKLHYGSEKNWCNKTGCNCQAFQAVQ